MILFCFRLIKKDKENTDQRAEGIESRVGSGSFSNLRRFKSWSSLNLDPASSHAGSFPPSRGRSMPERRQPSPEREEDKLGFMTLVCVCLLPATSLPEHTGFLLFVCFFLFLPRRKSGTFATLRGLRFLKLPSLESGFPSASDGKASVCNAGDPGSIPGLGRSPREGNGSPVQYSCLENPMDREAW